jgi:hypothetical protein
LNFNRLYKRIKPNLRLIIIASLTCFSSTIAPVLVLAEFIDISLISGVNIHSYLARVQINLLVCVVLGVLLSSFVVYTFFQQKHSKRHFILSVASLSITTLYLYLWSDIVSIKIGLDLVTVWLDFSQLYLFFLVIPIALIIRRISLYRKARQVLGYKLYILRLIQVTKTINSKTRLRSIIVNDYSIHDSTRDYLLKNLSRIIDELRESSRPLIIRKKGYKLTREGHLFYNSYRSSLPKIRNFTQSKILNIKDLEYWTEDELNKLNKGHIKSN